MEAPDTGDERITHAAVLHPPQEEAHQEDPHAAPRFTRAATSVPPAEVTADREAASCWPSYLPSPGPALPAQLVPRQGQGCLALPALQALWIILDIWVTLYIDRLDKEEILLL